MFDPRHLIRFPVAHQNWFPEYRAWNRPWTTKRCSPEIKIKIQATIIMFLLHRANIFPLYIRANRNDLKVDSWPCLWVLPQLALHRGWPSSQPCVYIRQLNFHKRISILLPIQLSVKAYGSLFNWQHRLAALQVVVSKYNLELMLSNTDQNLGQNKQYSGRTA